MTLDSTVREIVASEMSNFVDIILNRIEDFFSTLEIRESNLENQSQVKPNTEVPPGISPSSPCVSGASVPNKLDEQLTYIEHPKPVVAPVPPMQQAPIQTGPIKYPPSNESKDFNQFIATNQFIVKDRKKTLDVLQKYLPESIRSEQYATPLVWLNPAEYEKIKQELVMAFNGVV